MKVHMLTLKAKITYLVYIKPSMLNFCTQRRGKGRHEFTMHAKFERTHLLFAKFMQNGSYQAKDVGILYIGYCRIFVVLYQVLSHYTKVVDS